MYQEFGPNLPNDHDPRPWQAGVAVAIVLILADAFTELALGFVVICVISVLIGFAVHIFRQSRKERKLRKCQETRKNRNQDTDA